jgi:hypothetical protein
MGKRSANLIRELEETDTFDRTMGRQKFKRSIEAKSDFCSLHPLAPHGLDAEASEALDRYVCLCETRVPTF